MEVEFWEGSVGTSEAATHCKLIDGNYHYSPEFTPGVTYPDLCQPGNRVIQCPPSGSPPGGSIPSSSSKHQCPSKIQLPLGTWVNWVIAVIIILVIYYLIANTRSPEGKKSSKAKRKSKK